MWIKKVIPNSKKINEFIKRINEEKKDSKEVNIRRKRKIRKSERHAEIAKKIHWKWETLKELKFYSPKSNKSQMNYQKVTKLEIKNVQISKNQNERTQESRKSQERKLIILKKFKSRTK